MASNTGISLGDIDTGRAGVEVLRGVRGALATLDEGDAKAYVEKVDAVSASLTYIGKAVSGSATSAAVWQIQRISVSGTVTTTDNADGDRAFDNVWDDRASLAYS